LGSGGCDAALVVGRLVLPPSLEERAAKEVNCYGVQSS
jgi:hypothetical protein